MADGERTPDDAWPLGDVLRQARDGAGLSVREAAAAAGFSPTTWSSIETGTRKTKAGHEPAKPQSSNIVAAAHIVGLDVDEALRLAGYDPLRHNPERRGRPTVSQRSLADSISRLTERQRAAVQAVVEAMLEPDDRDVRVPVEPGIAETRSDSKPQVRESRPTAKPRVVEERASAEPRTRASRSRSGPRVVEDRLSAEGAPVEQRRKR